MAGHKVQRDYTFTFEKQSAWDTVIDTAPKGIPTADLKISQEPDEHVIPRSMGLRGDSETHRWQDTFATVPTAQVEFPATASILKQLLGGILQNSTAWSPSTSVYTMYTNNYANLPKPKAASEGYFYTLTRRSPASADSERIKNAIPTNFKFSLHPTENNGCLWIASDWIGQGYQRAQSPAGTVSHEALTPRYMWGSLAKFQIDAINLTTDFFSFELNVGSGAKYALDLPTGEVVFPLWNVNGKFTVAANANTETLKGYVLSRDTDLASQLDIQWGDGTPSSSGELNLQSFIYLTKFESDFTEGEQITFDFKGVFGGGAGEYPFKAIFHAA